MQRCMYKYAAVQSPCSYQFHTTSSTAIQVYRAMYSATPNPNTSRDFCLFFEYNIPLKPLTLYSAIYIGLVLESLHGKALRTHEDRPGAQRTHSWRGADPADYGIGQLAAAAEAGS